jgi:DNA-directed RNA polymerase specialized sigma24 family protein
MAPLTRLPFVAAGIDAVMAHSERRLMDEAAFQAFYSRTAGPVFGYLRRLTGNTAVAEDLLQDAYVRFLAASRLPEDDEHRKNYLYRIATNLARDRFRREKTENDAGGRFPPPLPR